MKLITARAAKIIAALLLLACLAGACRLLMHTGLLLAGRISVERAGAEPILLSGKPQEGGWLTLPEQIVLNAPEGIPQAIRTGVTCMGLLRFLPCFAALILCALMLINILRGQLLCKTNARLLCAAGAVITATAILLPLLNGYAIPALIQAASGAGIGVGLDFSRSPQLWQGLVLLLAAQVLHTGEQRA
ncbi:hypothetical protein MR810_05850 [bacterium]|nr:hypothetical protein [bacterium]